MSVDVKCVVVGDGTVGKTCLLTVMVNQRFPEDYIPTVFDTYRANCKIGTKDIVFSLNDTAGQEAYDNLRLMTYPGTNVFIICFAVDNDVSYENVRAKWVAEIKLKNPSTPMVLVGCKTDLRGTKPNCIPTYKGEALSKEIGAVAYMECSAKNNVGVKEVFEKSIMVGSGMNINEKTRKRGNKQEKGKRCSIM